MDRYRVVFWSQAIAIKLNNSWCITTCTQSWRGDEEKALVFASITLLGSKGGERVPTPSSGSASKGCWLFQQLLEAIPSALARQQGMRSKLRGPSHCLPSFDTSWVGIFFPAGDKIAVNNFMCAIKKNHSPLFVWTSLDYNCVMCKVS